MLEDFSNAPLEDQSLIVARAITDHKWAEQEILQRNEELSALTEIGRALSRLAEPSEILELIHTTIGRVLDNSNFYIALYDEASNEITFPTYFIDGQRQTQKRRPFGNGMTEYVIRMKEPLLIQSDVQDTATRLGFEVKGRLAACLMAVPMLVGEKVVGAIAVLDYHKTNVYGTKHIELLSTFAAQAAISVENARLFQETNRRAREFAALYDTSRDLSLQQDLPMLLQTIAQRAKILLAASSGIIYLFDAARSDLEVVVATDSSVPPGTRLRLGEGMVGRVAQTRESMIVNNYQNWPHRAQMLARVPIHATTGVPMLCGGELVGVLVVHEIGETTRQFMDTDVRLLSLFAGQAASAVHNARLYQMAKQELAERKRAEEALAYEQYLMRALMENVPDSIYFKDTESRFIRNNPAITKRFGLSDPAQAIGKTDFDFFTREFAEETYAQEQEIIKTGQPLIDREEKLTYTDGRVRWALSTKMPLRDQAGQIIGILGLGRDITKLKETEQALRESEERYHRQATHLQMVAEVGRVVTSLLDLDRVLPRVVDLIRDRFGYYHVGICLADETGTKTVLRAASGPLAQPSLAPDRTSLPIGGKSIIGFVNQTGQPYVSQDVTADPLSLYEPSLSETKSEAAIPLSIGDSVIGVLDVQSKQVNAFSSDAISILTTMADQIAVAIQNVCLHAEIQQLAITDALTSLYNRRGFFELSRHEFERARRFGRPLAAIILDLDCFKVVNDTYGHVVGDQVLAGVAVLCRRGLREVDLLGRYGGDEFVALLLECDLAGVKGVAERLRQSIAQTPINTDRGSVTITTSLGVAVLDKECADLETLLNRADQALLYSAKRAGRNRVCVWVDSGEV
jgi:diguanylate cyclase (GGDEF)-like protein/PAS domain S-box-containing protein